MGYKTGSWSWISHGWRDLHRSINLGQHIQSFVILVKLSGHCEITTVDEEVCGWERRLERSDWFAMFSRA